MESFTTSRRDAARAAAEVLAAVAASCYGIACAIAARQLSWPASQHLKLAPTAASWSIAPPPALAAEAPRLLAAGLQLRNFSSLMLIARRRSPARAGSTLRSACIS